MNKKIAMSLMSIVGALAIVGSATYALFDDSATATNNTFATGDANLEIALDTVSGPGTFGDSIVGPNFAEMIPGDSEVFSFWLRNNGSVGINLDITGDVSSIVGADPDQELDNALLVSWTCDTTGDNSLGDETPTSEFSPRDWFNGGNASLLLNIPSGTQRFCQMTGKLPITVDNTVAGETVVFDVLYDATQVAPVPTP